MSSKIKVDTIENVAGSGNVSLGSGHNLVAPGTSSIAGHVSIGVDAVSNTRALTVAGATDGSGSSALVVYNSSLASKFSVRDDGLTTITNNATVGGTLGVTGTATLSGNATIGTNSGDTRFSLNSANQYTMVLKNAGNIAGQIGGGGTDDLRFSNAAGTTTMQIKDGRVLKPLTPAFRCHRTAGNYTSTTVIVWNVVTYNQGGHYNSSNGRFTAPVTGVYQFNVMGSLTANPANISIHRVRINGSYQIDVYPIGDDITAHISYANSFLLNLSANDYIDISSASVGTWYGTGNVHNHFSGFLVG